MDTVEAVNTHRKKVNDFRDSKMLPSATPMKIIPENGRGCIGCTPLAVEAFGKEHRHVLRDIRETIDKCSESFTAPNFGFSEYTDSTGRSLDDNEKGVDSIDTPGGALEMLRDAGVAVEVIDN